MPELIDPNDPDPAHKPQIIVDSDWKAEAQKEKERLAEAETHSAESPGGGRGMPPADFRSLLGSLATQAIMYLGGIPDPDGRAIVAPEYAKHYIDLLGVLEQKTQGNLTDEESKELTGVLHELRVRFVEIVQGVAATYAEEEQQPGSGATPPPAKPD